MENNANSIRIGFLNANLLMAIYLDTTIYINLTLRLRGSSSVLFNLHGYGSNALAQMQYGDFRDFANNKENNFILIHPQGAPLNTALTSSASHWNSGGWTIGSTVDDVDFIDTIIGFSFSEI